MLSSMPWANSLPSSLALMLRSMLTLTRLAPGSAADFFQRGGWFFQVERSGIDLENGFGANAHAIALQGVALNFYRFGCYCQFGGLCSQCPGKVAQSEHGSERACDS